MYYLIVYVLMCTDSKYKGKLKNASSQEKKGCYEIEINKDILQEINYYRMPDIWKWYSWHCMTTEWLFKRGEKANNSRKWWKWINWDFFKNRIFEKLLQLKL